MRQILDALLVANEVIHSRTKSAKPGVVCKVDSEKAYDHINWGFLIYVMRRPSIGIFLFIL